jgi:hypothetical protein
MWTKLCCLFVFLCGFSLIWSSFSAGEEISAPYMYTVAFNDTIYGLTDEEISADQIDRFMGEAAGVVSPQINQNNRISCRVSECMAPPGTKFYTIKALDSNQGIAVEVPGGTLLFKYYKCVYINSFTG